MFISPVAPAGPVRLVPLQRLSRGERLPDEAMRSYSSALLLWFARGQGRITVAGLTRGFGPHNAVFVPAGTMHGFERGKAVIGTAVFFDDCPGVDLPAEPCHLRLRDAEHQSEMSALLDALDREARRDCPLRERALTLRAGLLALWIARHRAETEDRLRPSAARRLARRFTDEVERNIRSGQSVGDYARSLGVTPTHLSRVCRHTCGRPASELLADRLTFEARRLLLDTAMPVKGVAEALGFRSAAYFTRCFHARTGQTPTAFRRDGQA